MPQSSNPATPTTALPPTIQTDPQADEKVNTDVLDGLIRDLNIVRERLSAIMGEEFGEMRGTSRQPMAPTRSQMSVASLDREAERKQLSLRERQLLAAIREQRGMAHSGY